MVQVEALSDKKQTLDCGSIFLGTLSSHPMRGRAIISNLSPDLQSGKNEWMSLCPGSPGEAPDSSTHLPFFGDEI